MGFRQKAGAFIAAFLLTVSLGGLGVAFAAVEWNTRRVLYGQVTPAVGYTVQNGLPVVTDGEGRPLFSLSDNTKQGGFVLLSPAARGVLLLLRGEAAAVQRLGEQVLPPD